MVDDGPKLQFPQQMPGAQPPPTMNAGHILLTAGINEISVMLGQTRLLPVSGPNNQHLAQNFIEWFATITLSPPVAQQLRDGLAVSLDQYVKQFGPIPKQGEPKIMGADAHSPAPEVKPNSPK